MKNVKELDPEIYSLIKQEEKRQADKIRLIASENYVSNAILEATGCVLTNKYSEGYAGKRYYEGQQLIDQVEQLAIKRAKDLFGAEHANVQPYSGSPANIATYLAFLKPGDTILGMALPHGGHLTHGAKVSISGRYFDQQTQTNQGPAGGKCPPSTGDLEAEQVRGKQIHGQCRPEQPAPRIEKSARNFHRSRKEDLQIDPCSPRAKHIPDDMPDVMVFLCEGPRKDQKNRHRHQHDGNP